MQIHDVTLPISQTMVVWPDDPPVTLERVSDVADGDLATLSRVEMGVHTGTHVDAPKHFIPGGTGVEAMALDPLVGPALVVEVREVDLITADLLAELAIPLDAERVLFRTRNSSLWAEDDPAFHKDFVAISEDAARWLIERGLQLVGIDYLSVAPFDRPEPTHQALLRANVVVLEGLDLSEVGQGMYMLVCLPLKIAGADGAPARVVLLEDIQGGSIDVARR